MKTSTKVIVGVAVLGAAGVAGYFGYKKYLESKDDTTTGLGAFTDGGYSDYNAYVAHKYWTRMNQMNTERLHLQSMKG
jgi:hypothetical protein